GGEGKVERPLHVAFVAKDRPTVDAFYRAALAAGGKDNGPPGLRPHYHSNYYGAFVLDHDGHNIEAVCHAPRQPREDALRRHSSCPAPPEPNARQAIDWPSRSRTVASTEGVRRSDCLHGYIHEMLEVRWSRIGNYQGWHAHEIECWGIANRRVVRGGARFWPSVGGAGSAENVHRRRHRARQHAERE